MSKKYGMLFSSVLGDTPNVMQRLETMTMKTLSRQFTARMLDIGYEEFLPFFDGFGEGLLIVDRTGTIIYYNPTMTAIDELAPADVLGKKVLDVYDLTEEGSLIMQCLKTRVPIIDRSLLYRTRWGKIANTLHTVFPLFKRGRLAGAICLVREYNVMEETISAVSIPRSTSGCCPTKRGSISMRLWAAISNF
jgi:transcriptional regulator with PAS, ATPase and Fis domain